ncbi:MAG: hypothetical protein R3A44_02955 [Caldilineaceae bacterium]
MAVCVDYIGVAIEGPGVTLAAAALAGNGLLNPFWSSASPAWAI